MVFMDFSQYRYCFGCGADNPAGLQLKPQYKGEKSHIEFLVKSEYCGYPGVLHGGVAGILFDEAMFYAIARTGMETVTLSMTIDYKSPALINERLVCEGWIEKQEGRKIEVAAIIQEQSTGRVTASGRGNFLQIDAAAFLKRHASGAGS